MSDPTIETLMARMPRAFLPENAEGVTAVIQYRLTGDEGGDWAVTIRDGQCEVRPGTAEDPQLTLEADAQDYKDIVTGKTNAMQAFMLGKIRLSGDLNLAMKLTTMFKMN